MALLQRAAELDLLPATVSCCDPLLGCCPAVLHLVLARQWQEQPLAGGLAAHGYLCTRMSIPSSPLQVPAEGAEAAAAAWRAALPRFAALVERHVGALHEAYRAGLAMGEKEAAAEVRALVPIALVRVLLPHCAPEAAGALRSILRDLGT